MISPHVHFKCRIPAIICIAMSHPSDRRLIHSISSLNDYLCPHLIVVSQRSPAPQRTANGPSRSTSRPSDSPAFQRRPPTYTLLLPRAPKERLTRPRLHPHRHCAPATICTHHLPLCIPLRIPITVLQQGPISHIAHSLSAPMCTPRYHSPLPRRDPATTLPIS